MPVYGNARRRHVGLGSLIDRAGASDASNGASRTSRIVSTQGVPRQVPFLHKPVAGSNRGHATTYVERGSDRSRDADHPAGATDLPTRRATPA
jgi:hypothetical protein